MVFLAAIRIEKMTIWRLGRLGPIRKDRPERMGTWPPFRRAHDPPPNQGKEWISGAQFPLSISPWLRVKGVSNVVFLAEIRIGNRAFWRGDGLATIFAGPPEIMAARPQSAILLGPPPRL